MPTLSRGSEIPKTTHSVPKAVLFMSYSLTFGQFSPLVYGWPEGLSDDEILHRLVALNRERAAEEARGHIRWLRPDYQNPAGRTVTKGEQITFDVGQTDTATKAPWPKTLPEQIAAVRNALSDLGTATPEQVPANSNAPAPHRCNRFWKALPLWARPASWKAADSPPDPLCRTGPNFGPRVAGCWASRSDHPKLGAADLTPKALPRAGLCHARAGGGSGLCRGTGTGGGGHARDFPELEFFRLRKAQRPKPHRRISRQTSGFPWVGFLAGTSGNAAIFLMNSMVYGGAEGDRTPDLVIANDALSQLSYCPATCGFVANRQGNVKRPSLADFAKSQPLAASVVRTKSAIWAAGRLPVRRPVSRPW